MQLRYQTGLTGEQYVSTEAWRSARLDRCPNHDRPGSCSLARHGVYRRKRPHGALIARWYCPESHTTFSLLPDCLAAQLPGTLEELETVVARAEQASSLMQAADQVRTDTVGLPGAMRWLDRRVRLVRQALQAVIVSLPDRDRPCTMPMRSCAARWRCSATALIADLAHLPPGAAGIGEQLRARAAQTYAIPGTLRTRVAAETLRDWLHDYRLGGFDALYPKPRADRGQPRRLPPQAAELLIALKTEHPAWPVRQVIEHARENTAV